MADREKATRGRKRGPKPKTAPSATDLFDSLFAASEEPPTKQVSLGSLPRILDRVDSDWELTRPSFLIEFSVELADSAESDRVDKTFALSRRGKFRTQLPKTTKAMSAQRNR